MKLGKTAAADLRRFRDGTAYKAVMATVEDAYKAAIYNASTQEETVVAANLLKTLEVHRRILESLDDSQDAAEMVNEHLRAVV